MLLILFIENRNGVATANTNNAPLKFVCQHYLIGQRDQ